jgi:hypothetical protein
MTEEDLVWLRSEFDRCAPWIQAALDRDIGAFELEDVWNYIAAGKAQLWPQKESAVVTALEYFPRKTVLRYWLCGGDLKDCLKVEPVIEKWAKEAGAVCAIIGGRRGWVKALKGYTENCVYMTKAL